MADTVGPNIAAVQNVFNSNSMSECLNLVLPILVDIFYLYLC